jgi:hypothetical protein
MSDDVSPVPEPEQEPHEHLPPLDADADARFLDPADPRRIEVERRHGPGFLDSLRED